MTSKLVHRLSSCGFEQLPPPPDSDYDCLFRAPSGAIVYVKGETATLGKTVYTYHPGRPSQWYGLRHMFKESCDICAFMRI